MAEYRANSDRWSNRQNGIKWQKHNNKETTQKKQN